MAITRSVLSTTPVTPRRLYWDGLALSPHDGLAVFGVIAFCLVAAGWGAAAGLTFTPPIHLLAILPVTFAFLAAGYHVVRPQEYRLFPLLLYVALWAALPIAGTRLTFLANMANMPLRSELFAAADQAIGFSWIGWAKFMTAHPALSSLTGQAYLSYAFQPYVALIIAAFTSCKKRNAKLIIGTMIALAVTIAVSALVPAIEPANAHGYRTPAWDALSALRSGQRTDLPYIGIICFPSFHAAMAVLFTSVYRGLKWALVPAALLNFAMLLSVPYSGDHYLVDLFAGIVVALAAIGLADKIVGD
jgi:PAP2 superfamily